MVSIIGMRMERKCFMSWEIQKSGYVTQTKGEDLLKHSSASMSIIIMAMWALHIVGVMYEQSKLGSRQLSNYMLGIRDVELFSIENTSLGKMVDLLGADRDCLSKSIIYSKICFQSWPRASTSPTSRCVCLCTHASQNKLAVIHAHKQM